MSSDGAPSTPPAPDPRDEARRALLRRQPWGELLAQITAIAFRRIRGRSMSDAQDLAQSAIADAYRSIERGGWDPEKGPLQAFLVGSVIGRSNNERRRKRNTCEVWLDREEEDDENVSRHEAQLREDRPAPDEALHRLRFAATFHERLLARLSSDELAVVVLGLMLEGLATPVDLADGAGRPIDEVREARRRIKYHAREITKELSASAGSARADDENAKNAKSKEVVQ